MYPTPAHLGLAVLLACFTATSPLAANGQYSSASASVSNLRIELIDLDPNDGIAPYLNYRDNPPSPFPHPSDLESWTVVEHTRNRSVTHTESHDSESAFGATPIAIALHPPVDLPAGRAAGQAVFAGTSLDTLGLSASSSIDGMIGDGRTVLSAAGFSPKYFYLSPNTALSISVDLAVQSALQGGGPAPTDYGRDVALASAWLSIFGSYDPAHSAYDFYLRAIDFADDKPADGAPRSQTFTALIEAAPVEQTIYVAASANAYVTLTPERVVPPPVPEPDIWAMIAAGLGMLGALRYRGRRGERPSRTA